jgi:hypothetical protein
MAIARVTGNALADNLQRSTNLAIDTDAFYVDVANNRIGVNTTSTTHAITTPDDASIGNIVITGNSITAEGPLNLAGSTLSLGAVGNVEITGGSAGQVMSTDGAGNLSFVPIGNVGGLTGNVISLGTPTDGDLTTNVAYNDWTTSTFVTDGLDDLNQVALNIANGTYVGQVDFSGTPVAGPSPQTVTFSGNLVGTADNYLWDFGDGNTATSGLNVSHTYSNVSGGQFTVSLTAFNSDGTYQGNVSLGAKGSVDTKTRTNYITLYTPNPVPSFTITDNSIDSGALAEINNTSTNVTTSYELDWGDGVANTNPALGWTTLTNTYTNSGGDEQYTIVLAGTSNTAGPTPVTVYSAPGTVSVYSDHTSQFTTSATTVVNEEATSGGVVTFTNTVATDPGTTATFGSQQKYLWTWDDGSVANVNIQSGVAGNPGSTIDHTFALSSGNQSGGTSQTFDVTLQVRNDSTNSPFVSGTTTITVEPDVRAIYTGTAVTTSDRSGDNAQDGYVFTDYRDSADRALFTFDNTSQNGTTFDWTFGDGNTTGNITSGAGTPGGGNITNSYSSTGNYTVELDVYGTPATIAQSDSEVKSNYIQINANPAQPGALSTKTLSLADSSQGTSPLLAANATDNSGGNIVAAGSSVTRYTTTTTINTNNVTNANTAISGTLSAIFNNSSAGNVTFTSGGDAAGTYTDLIVVADGDAHDEISASTYPSGFAKVFDARWQRALSGISVGYNDAKLSHTTTGDTNLVDFVKDDMTDVPTVVQGNAVIVEQTAGTYRYISGVPYYNTGSPAIQIQSLEVSNLTGQTYRNTSQPIQFTTGTLDEGTSGSIINTQTKTYGDIDGSPSFVTAGIVDADVGVSANQALGNISLSINGSARAVGYVDSQMFNVNGSSSVVNITDKYIQIYSASLTGFDEQNIPVADALGSVYDDDGLRITGLGSAADNPAFNSATNYYTDNAWSGAETIAGTQEAVVRWGTLDHFTTDFSSGYLPSGPDLATGRSGTQYFTFAFRRATMANFDISLNSSTGITGLWIAAPGTTIDDASTQNGWIDGTVQYAGSGVPGDDTGNGGNGSLGCALTGADVIPTGTSINAAYTMTLGSENSSNSTGNNVLVRIALASGETLTSVSVGVAS